MDVDALDFVAINPHYNPLKYQPDGLCTTRKECDSMAAEASGDDGDYDMEWAGVPTQLLLPTATRDTSSPATLSNRDGSDWAFRAIATYDRH